LESDTDLPRSSMETQSREPLIVINEVKHHGKQHDTGE